MIAHIARYHRGAPPKIKHVGFGQLDKQTRERIVKLSALLRFADGMDRGHVGAVGSLTVKWGADTVRVVAGEAEGAANVRLECWGASRKRHLLEEVLGRPILVMLPDGTEVTADDDGDGE
jgi:exopolyphosphatase/guanosine-5'-triphosphate,3'-diphosphate pyrophosphatase